MSGYDHDGWAMGVPIVTEDDFQNEPAELVIKGSTLVAVGMGIGVMLFRVAQYFLVSR